MLKNKVKTHKFLLVFLFLLIIIVSKIAVEPTKIPKNVSVKIPNKFPLRFAYFFV